MTQIVPTVDFGKEGKQVGWLRVPHSVTRSAYGTLSVPVAVIQNGSGPGVLLLAGTHGDEYEGQAALTRLIHSLDPGDISGRVIVIPSLNMPAAEAGTRVSPLDDGNLNRVFPGDPAGGPTWKIADYVDNHLLPLVDVVADFHAGGASLEYRPHASVHYAADASPDHKQRSLELVKVLGVPHVMVFKRGPGAGTLPGAAMRKGVISLGGEYGGTGSVSRSGVALVRQAVARIFEFLGMMGSLPPDLTEPKVMRIFGPSAYVYAPDHGIFEPATSLGEAVRAGDLCGHVLFPENPVREPISVAFEGDGEVVCRRHPGRTKRGDCLAHLAAEVAPGE